MVDYSPPPEFYDRATDEEMEQERQYDLHCKEEYERLFLNRITLGEVYPSDFGIQPDQPATAASNDHTRTTAQTATSAERAASVKAKRSTARAPKKAKKDSCRKKDEVLTPTEQAAVLFNLCSAESDPDKTSIASRVYDLSATTDSRVPSHANNICFQLFLMLPITQFTTVAWRTRKQASPRTWTTGSCATTNGRPSNKVYFLRH